MANDPKTREQGGKDPKKDAGIKGNAKGDDPHVRKPTNETPNDEAPMEPVDEDFIKKAK
jgi:hypothetical protein